MSIGIGDKRKTGRGFKEVFKVYSGGGLDSTRVYRTTGNKMRIYTGGDA